MFFYGVEDKQFANAGSNHPSTQQMVMMLENQSPRAIGGASGSSDDHPNSNGNDFIKDKRLI